MNGAQNKETELRNGLSTAFSDMKIREILDITAQNQALVYQIFDQCLMILNSTDYEDKFTGFALYVLDELVKAYGIPVVALFNSPEVTSALYSIAIRGYEKDVISLLKICLTIFSEDEGRGTIPHIANLWKRLCPGKAFPYKQVPTTKFFHIFCHVQKILHSFNRLGSATEKERIDLQKYVQGMVEFEDFYDKEFSPLELECAVQYLVNLVQILSSLESEINGSSEKKEPVLEKKQKIFQDFEEEKNVRLPVQNNRMSLEDSAIIAMARSNNPLQISQIQEDTHPKSTDIRYKTSFLLNETLGRDESDSTEYKLYYYPFSDDNWKMLRKTICSFLNRRGGRIYIGVNDNRTVKGLSLTSKQRDELKLDIQEVLRSFEPDVMNSELVKTMFLPIVRPQDGTTLPGLFLVKIIVKQGDTSKLYSVSKAYLSCYIRNDGQSVLLNARETTDLILKRDKAPEARVPLEQFNDREPEEIIDVFSQKQQAQAEKLWLTKDVKKKKEQKSIKEIMWVEKQVPANGAIGGLQGGEDFVEEADWRVKAGVSEDQEIFEVFVTNLPNGMTKKQFKDFYQYGNKYKSVVYSSIKTGKGGFHKGIVYFADIQEANEFIEENNFRKYFGNVLRVEFKFAS